MTAQTPGRTMPDWLTQFGESFRAAEAHAFILHGDVEGIAFEGVSQRALLLATLGDKRDVIATYALGRGVTIWQEDEPITVGQGTPEARTMTRRARALELVGADQQPEQDNLLSQLAGGGLVQIGGAQQGSDPFAEAQSPPAALALLGKLLRGGKRVAVIIDHADAVVPPSMGTGKGALSPADRVALVSLLDLARDPIVARLANVVFMTTRALDELHPDVRSADSGWRALHLRLPDRDERLAYLRWYAARREAKGKTPVPLLGGLTDTELANYTAGLSLRDIENVLLLGAQSGGVARAAVRDYKDRVIQQQYSDVLSMIEPLPGGFADVGGMEPVKQWFMDNVIQAVREGRYEDVPKGILLVGPPGTGKTWLVRALAYETGFNGVALNAAKLLGSLLGESEQKLARALDYARTMRPTLVFLDEIDQSDLARRGDQSGNPAAANMFNAFMQELSDETLRGSVVFIFGTNRPDKLDSALMRNGRMDAVIPVLLPQTPEERTAVVTRQAQTQGLDMAADARDEAGLRTDQWSNADLAALVRKVRQLARREGTQTANVPLVRAALASLKPQTVEQAAFYTKLAVEACNDTDLLPPRYKTALDERGARARSRDTVPADVRDEREW